MWQEEKIDTYIKEALKSSRYNHSLGVRDTAEELARLYKVDTFKARIAGLVHDCAKNMRDEEILDIVSKYDYAVDEVCMKSPQLLHGLAGALVAENIMGILDRDILDAVISHTTGKPDMTVLEKIIYLADYIEPSREFLGVDELRQLSYIDLDKALLLSFDNTIKYVIDRGELLHYNTISARNYLLYKK